MAAALDRHLPPVSSDPVEFANTDTMIRLLECPICNEIPSSHICICETGHSICQNCLYKTPTCPYCHHRFTISRNYALESIIGTARYGCVYRDTGCPVLTTAEENAAHVAKCEFGPVLCFQKKLTSCSDVPIELFCYPTHLIEKHGISGQQVEDYDMFCEVTETIPTLATAIKIRVEFDPSYIRIQEKVFLKTTSYKQGTLYWWMTLVSGIPEEADDYQCTIVVHTNSNRPHVQGAEITFSNIPVHHIRKSRVDILGSGGYASLPLRLLKGYCKGQPGHSGNELSYGMKYSISKVKKPQQQQEKKEKAEAPK